jgi:hypothetical protein
MSVHRTRTVTAAEKAREELASQDQVLRENTEFGVRSNSDEQNATAEFENIVAESDVNQSTSSNMSVLSNMNAHAVPFIHRELSVKDFMEEGKLFGYEKEDLRRYVEERRAEEIRRKEREAEKQEREAERQFKLEELRIQASSTNNKNNNQGQSHRQEEGFTPKIPYFQDNDDLESFLFQFEQYAVNFKWEKCKWAFRLSTLLKGKARLVYSKLKPEEAADYDKLKQILLESFQLTAEAYREKFRRTKKSATDSYRDYVTKLEMYLDRWAELSGKGEDLDDFKDLILQEQILENLPTEMVVHIGERQPDSASEIIEIATTYETARNRKKTPSHSSSHLHPKENVTIEREPRNERLNHGGDRNRFPQQDRNKKTCFQCKREGHFQIQCPMMSKERAQFAFQEDSDEDVVAMVIEEEEIPNPVRQKFQSGNFNLSPGELKKEQESDPSLNKVRQLADKKIQRGAVAFEYKKGILYRRYTDRQGRKMSQLVVPKKLRDKVLTSAHDSPMAGHQGQKKTKERVWQEFFWPGMCGDIRRYCASCDTCQRTSPRGRVKRGPMGVLRQAWTEEETCQIAKENLKQASTRQAKYYDRHTKKREFEAGQKVLLLLPTKHNKLELAWQGPFEVEEKVNSFDYKIKNKSSKIFHINLLREYVERECDDEEEESEFDYAAVVVEESSSEQGSNFTQEETEAIPLLETQRTETVNGIHYRPKLTENMKKEARKIFESALDNFTDIPLTTKLGNVPLESTKGNLVLLGLGLLLLGTSHSWKG